MKSFVPRRVFAAGVAAAAVSLVATFGLVAAQSPAGPIAGDSTVSRAVGSAAAGSVDVTLGNITICSYTAASKRAFGVSREMGAFGPAEGGVGALAQRYIPSLPDAARSEIDALQQAGMNVTLPGYPFD